MDLSNPAVETFERMVRLSSCIECVADLLVPDEGTGHISRDRLTLLLDFLATEQRLAQERLWQLIND